jgi:hypothetical protein
VPWLLVDVVLALLALAVLGFSALSLWRAVKGLGREVSRAGTEVGDATDALARAQAEAPAPAVATHAGPRPVRPGARRR